MAIVTETFILNNIEFTRTYSDSNRFVVRDGIEYTEANDPSEFGRVYTEGNIIPLDDRDYSEANEILSIILGGEE